jgi:hypothetical protein
MISLECARAELSRQSHFVVNISENVAKLFRPDLWQDVRALFELLERSSCESSHLDAKNLGRIVPIWFSC